VTATPVQVRQWSEEVAADPASLSFLPLAGAYRDQGRVDAALRLCIRGLEKHPTHVDAHHLLGLLYRDAGELVKAFDEWDIALALSPEHAPSRREIGLAAAALGDWRAALRHLVRAAAHERDDAEVQAALSEARVRAGEAARPPAQPAAPPPEAEPPPSPTPAGPATSAPTAEDASAYDAAQQEFEALAAERGIAGALLLDDQGFVLAGTMDVRGTDHGAEVAAVLSGARSEAERALRHLKLGGWQGILVETPEAVVRLAPAGPDAMVAVAGRREVPTGWVLRVAGRAGTAAVRLLDGAGDT
jgi:tetratricopeptide (TPR) repeat protein